MNPSCLRAGLLGAAFLAVTITGCSRDSQPAAVQPPASASAQPVAAPDRLAPDELPEGKTVAFDLPIPRGMRVNYAGPFEVQAEGPYPAEKLSNYVRRHIKAKTVELGAARTVFDQARVLNASTNRLVQVEVITHKGGSRLLVRDLTPHRIDDSLTPEQRWKKHGFDRDGTFIGDKRFE